MISIRLISFLCIAILVSTFLSCTSEFEKTIKSELNGKWQIVSTGGGISGAGYTPNFEFLEVDDDLNFVLTDILNQFVAEGCVRETTTSSDEQAVDFEASKKITEGIEIINEFELFVFVEADTLDLVAPCCDRYGTRFIRTE